jgi:hypothetical protein
MKIEGWDKINGFTYKGHVITNADYDAQANSYYADILNLNDSESLGWFMNLWPQENGVHLLKITDIATAPKSTVAQKGVTNDRLRNLRMFRVHYEGLVEEMILLTKTHTSNVVGSTTGIINQVQNAGTNVTYSSHSISNGLSNLSVMQQALNAMRELEEQLDELKKQYPL